MARLAIRAGYIALMYNHVLVYSAASSLTMTYDVVVYGATPAGIAAAVVAANGTGLRVALLEPTALVGGMAGPGGIGLRDIAEPDTIGNDASVIRHWLSLNSASYGVSNTVWQPDERIGQANWWALLAEPTLHSLDVFTNVGMGEAMPFAPWASGYVQKNGTTIAGIATVSTITENPSNVTLWYAAAFVDASYEADIVMRANVSFTYGRESKTAYNESLAGVQPQPTFSQFQHPVDPFWTDGSLLSGVDAGPLPPAGSSDARVMPYSYRLCVTDDPDNRLPWPQPEGYNSTDFELLRRYAVALATGEHAEGAPISAFVDELQYNGYPASSSRSMRYDRCESGGSAVSTDEPSAAYDAYITGNRSVRAAVAQRVRYWVAGMMWTLANGEGIPNATRASTAAWGLCKDAWPSAGNWPPLLYVREGVRLLGDAVATQNSLVKGVCDPTSIGLGAWTIDVHIMNRVVGSIAGAVSAVNEGEIGFAQLPGNGSVYEIPYATLLPRRSEATNLLVPVCPSASHIAFASLRVEPTFMQLGTAAGVAARLVAQAAAATAGGGGGAAPHRLAAQDIPMATLQAGIVAAGQCVHWPDCFNVAAC